MSRRWLFILSVLAEVLLLAAFLANLVAAEWIWGVFEWWFWLLGLFGVLFFVLALLVWRAELRERGKDLAHLNEAVRLASEKLDSSEKAIKSNENILEELRQKEEASKLALEELQEQIRQAGALQTELAQAQLELQSTKEKLKVARAEVKRANDRRETLIEVVERLSFQVAEMKEGRPENPPQFGVGHSEFS